jgi:hypothetical protein
VFEQLQQIAEHSSSTAECRDAENGRRLAIVSAAPAAAAAMLSSSNSQLPQQLAAAAQQAQQLACSAGVEGRLAGAAAVSWVQLVCMQMNHSSSSSSSVTEQVSLLAYMYVYVLFLALCALGKAKTAAAQLSRTLHNFIMHNVGHDIGFRCGV